MDHPIVFYDGQCGLCNRSVRWLIRIDRKAIFRYATLQGNAAQKTLDEKLWKAVNTFVLYTDDGVYIKSEAFFEALKIVGGGWRFFGIFRFLPLRVRDMVYDWVARNRFRVFAQYDHCLVPSDHHRSLFLD